jgi:glycosyltransferase involved in cell wall biosynthesis
MNVAVINPFDPLPGEGFRPGRYAALCAALVRAGHCVRWYSSSFWHEFKKPRDEPAIHAAARKAGYEVRLIQALGYSKNLSLQRLRDHAAVAHRLRNLIQKENFQPDAIAVSLPPPVLGAVAADWSRQSRARLVVDVQDLWPETFRRFWPAGLGWLNGLLFAGVRRDARRTLRSACALAAVAEGYIREVRPDAPPETPTAVLPLGVDLERFDAGVQPLSEIGLDKPSDQRWLFLGGAIRSHIDVKGTAELLAELARRGRRDVRLVVVADDATTPTLRAEVQRLGLTNVDFLGYRPYEEFVSIAAACDLALCPLNPAAMVYLPNRVFDCFAAGLPVLQSGSAEVARLLDRHKAGFSVAPGQPSAWADAAEHLLAHPLPSDHRARRGEWVGHFDRRQLAERFARFVTPPET